MGHDEPFIKDVYFVEVMVEYGGYLLRDRPCLYHQINDIPLKKEVFNQ